VVCSTRLKALNGTWPPLGKADADAMAAPPKTAVEAALEAAAAAVLEAAVGATLEAPPTALVLELPPATSPVLPDG
jgi:hypothetical protein